MSYNHSPQVVMAGVRGRPGPRGEPFSVDVALPMSKRADYDSQPSGFSFLDTDTGHLYIRQGVSGWSDGVPFSGPQGVQGEPGDQGPKGDQGDPGPKGDQGDPGPKGDQGDQGTGLNIIGTLPGSGDLPQTGNPGDGYLIAGDLWVWSQTTEDWVNTGRVKGDPGDPGPKGDKGDQGEQGDPGPKGDQGDQGDPGPKGDKGDQGDPGDPGPKGDKGDQGDKGDPGPKGDKGDPGPKGDKGDQGDPGPKGDPGGGVESVVAGDGISVDDSDPANPVIRATGGAGTEVNVQTGTAYTLVLTDAFKMVTTDNADANTLTVPPNSAVAFPANTRIDIGQDGAGQTTIVAGAGVTIRTPETLKLRKQWSKATLIRRAADAWDLVGDLEVSGPEPALEGFWIKTTGDVVAEIEGPGSVPGTGVSVNANGSIGGGELAEVLAWPAEKPDWLSGSKLSFTGATNLTKVPDTLPAWITDTTYMFAQCTSFNQDLSGWDTSNVTNMDSMFRECSSFNGALSGWDTSNVTNMNSMFFNCPNFNQDLSSWDTSNVTNMTYMFRWCSSFNGDLSSWNTSNVTDMSHMFRECSSFNQDISGWDTGSVTTMSTMLAQCTSFNQDLSGWDTSNVTNMAALFFKCTNFNQDLSGWCVSNITSEPANFSDDTTSWTLPKPIWGTCPA